MAKKRKKRVTAEPPDLLDLLDEVQATAQRVADENRGATASTAQEVLAGIRCLYREMGRGRVTGEVERVAYFALLLGIHYQRLMGERSAELTPDEVEARLPNIEAATRRRSAKRARTARTVKTDKAKSAKRENARQAIDDAIRADQSLSVDDAIVAVAEQFNVSERTVYRWLKDDAK